MIDVELMVGWIIKHPKREDAFPGWPDEQIARIVLEHIRDNELLLVTTREDENKICGIMLYSVNDNEHIIRIQHILANSTDTFKAFLTIWYTYYSTYDLIGSRGRKERRYTVRNFQKLLRKDDTPYHVTESSDNKLLVNN